MEKNLTMPALCVAGKMKAEAMIAAGERTLKENWVNKERHPNDPNCIISYGVDKGEVYGSATQLDMEEYLELARLKREIELANPKNHDNNPFLQTYGLPLAVKLDIEARGYSFDQEHDKPEINKIIEKEFAGLKWTNVILTHL